MEHQRKEAIELLIDSLKLLQSGDVGCYDEVIDKLDKAVYLVCDFVEELV